MWTPKRVLLMFAGLALFVSAYGIYASFLGGIDGLPPLPEDYWPGAVNAEPMLPRPKSTADLKLQMAFGQGWEEQLKCSIKLELKAKYLVLATNDFVIEEDGRVKLSPFNIAVFGKEKGDGKIPEINTVQSDVAYLTFEKPISNIADMGRHKIIASELRDNILIRNNRRSTQRDDDLSLSTPGPLFYRDDQNLAWTKAGVLLFDTQSKSEPTKITAVGMELHLTKAKETTKSAVAAPGKNKSESISGVESIHLLATVEMHLCVDGNSGFLGGPPTNSKPPVNQPQEKPKLVITTEGPFRYVVSQDHAVAPDRAFFDIPRQGGPLPEKVTVTRLVGVNGQEKRDQLLCEKLVISFGRKSSATAGKEGHDVDLAIQDAHATGRLVELKSEAEGLHAIGNDFFYDARTKRSILKGTPEMVAMKDGHEIYASELQMENAGQKEIQQAKARGPGRIAMLNRTSVKRTMHARWRDELEFNKEGTVDRLTFVGDAAFEDQESGQQLRADRIKLWLQPADGDATASSEPRRPRPHHMEATGHVRADSPDLHIKDPTEHLMIWFKDAPARPAAASVDADPPEGAGARSINQLPEATAGDGGPAPNKAPNAAEKSTTNSLGLNINTPGDPANKNKKPLDLSARSIDAYVIRIGEKNELDRLWCQGAVHVHQEPASADDKGVDILGDTLQLNHAVEGGILIVTGNLAQVQMNKICILGPEVTINQRSNKATVTGIGAMQMLTKTSLEGEQLTQPTELTIHWNKDMFFNGQYALFRGGIQAEQSNSRLVCQELQVFLDRPVSFRDGDKGGQPAKVKDLVCDKSVRIDDETREGSMLLRYSRLTSPSVALNNEDGIVNSSGPGVVHIHQLESKDDPVQGANKGNDGANGGKKNEDRKELMLTRVSYLYRMYANNKNRTAIFYGDVDIVHLPTDQADVVVDVDRPPPGCMHMHCEQLKVFTHKQADGRTSQEMEASRKVVVDAQEFWGRADLVKYDESKDLIIFEGGEDGMAILYRVKNQAAQPSKIKAKKIFFWRKTNGVRIEGGQEINVN